MEFLKSNLINTTTQIAVNSNTSTVSNIFNRDIYYQYFSDGLNNDATTASITITFSSTTSVSRIALMDTNAEEFRIFYNGATANAFTLLNADTTTSVYTGNTDDYKYFRFSTVAVSSITLEIKTTQTENQEKRIGLLFLSDLYHAMTRIPDSRGYKPRVDAKQVIHRMSDGGTRLHNVRKKYSLDLSVDYIERADRDSLLDIYNLQTEFNFCPFGTATSWEGILFEAVWEGDFDFYEYSDNAATSGFSGTVRLRETPV
jgi:hypothetical protein